MGLYCVSDVRTPGIIEAVEDFHELTPRKRLEYTMVTEVTEKLDLWC